MRGSHSVVAERCHHQNLPVLLLPLSLVLPGLNLKLGCYSLLQHLGRHRLNVALFYKVPDLVAFRAVNLNCWLSDAYFFLCRTVYVKRINSWSGGISCSQTPLETAWSCNRSDCLPAMDMVLRLFEASKIWNLKLLGLKIHYWGSNWLPFSYSLSWEEKFGYNNYANYNNYTN